MKIDLKDVVESLSHRGKTYYVCDYRRPDLSKKAARSLAPTQVVVLTNADYEEVGMTPPRVYYSNVALAKVTKNGEPKYKSLVPPFDNTGYRSFTGIGINVFDNMDECVDFYNAQVQAVVDVIEENKKFAVERLQEQIDETKTLIITKKG